MSNVLLLTDESLAASAEQITGPSVVAVPSVRLLSHVVT